MGSVDSGTSTDYVLRLLILFSSTISYQVRLLTPECEALQ